MIWFPFRMYNYLKYEISSKLDKTIVVITMDDVVNNENIKVAEFLHKKGISATFFVPTKLVQGKIMKRLVKLGHELGGHGYRHIGVDRKNNYVVAEKCIKMLRAYDKKCVSWRFPWLSVTKEGIENVKKAGFKIDSSKGTFYPFKEIKNLVGLAEMPFLRLHPKWQMDINVEYYAQIFNYVIKMIKNPGMIVLPFHIEFQNKRFDWFKNLVEILISKKVKFMNLREGYDFLKK